MTKHEQYIFGSALTVSLVVVTIVLCAHYMDQEPTAIPDLVPVAHGRFGMVEYKPTQLSATHQTNTGILVGAVLTLTVLSIPFMLVWNHVKHISSIKNKLLWLVGKYLTKEEINAMEQYRDEYCHYLDELRDRASNGDLIAHDTWKSLTQKPEPETTWFFFVWW